MKKRIIALLMAAMLLVSSALADSFTLLHVGSKDTGDNWAVYSLQSKLIELGYLSGSADGNFGSGTEQAVKDFQSDHGLEVTGIADETTQSVLYAASQAVEAPEMTSADGKTQRLGEVDVTIIQTYLYQWGFLMSKPDGKFGQASTEAMMKFQKYAYDDMYPYTMALREQYTPIPTPEPTPTPAPGEMGDVEDLALGALSPIVSDGHITDDWFIYMQEKFDPSMSIVSTGDSNDDVARLQRRLYALRYLPGGVDGTFGVHTEAALKYFQRRNGLSETGVTDKETQEVLFSGKAIESDQYVTLYKAYVSIDNQRVYIYKWSGSDYTDLVHTFICSTGSTANPTKLGTFQATGRAGDWFYMEDSFCWVRYAFVIDGGYFFHSVLFMQKGGEPTSTSVRNLGTRASHGCVRLAVDDAKWIYENCSNGMTVVIYEGSKPE